VRDQPTAELTPTALTARELVVSNLGDARRLVWAITDRLPDGQGQGPVALAEVGVHGVGLRALGTLRTFPDNASLRLEKLGTNTVLVAEGEKCAGTGADCERAIRLLPLVGDRFVSKPIIDDQQACLGSAFFPVRTKGGIGRQTSTKLRAGSHGDLQRRHHRRPRTAGDLRRPRRSRPDRRRLRHPGAIGTNADHQRRPPGRHRPIAVGSLAGPARRRPATTVREGDR